MGRPKSFDEEKLLSAAARVFWENGYRATTIGDIAKATGVRPGSLHNYFGGKSELFAATVEHYMRTVSFAKLLQDGASADRVEDWLGGVFDAVAERTADPEFPNGCLVINSLIELQGTEPKLAAQLQTHLAKAGKVVARRLEAAKAARELPPDTDVAELTDFVTTVLQGILTSARAGASAASLRRAGRQAITHVTGREAVAPA